MKAAIAIGAILLGGAGIGFAMERTGFYSPVGEPVVAAGLYEVPYYACPGEDSVGDFHGGDRVFITGKTADADWLELRAPHDVNSRVWVERRSVIEDSDLGAIAETDCEVPLFEAAATTTSTTEPVTTTTEPASTTTTEPASTTTAEPAATTTPPAVTTTEPATTATAAPTTTTTEATTTTATTSTTEPTPPDVEGPIIDFFQASESDLWEDAVYGGCATQVHTAQVGGVATDPSGVLSVWVDWSVGTSSGTVAAVELADAVYFAEIGPFPDTAVTADQPIFLQLTAYDIYSNETIVSSSGLTVLHNCAIG